MDEIQRLREAIAQEKKRADDYKKRADDYKKRADDYKKRADDVEQKSKDSVYFEYLQHIQTEIPPRLRSETNLKLAAVGQTNASNKVYPRVLRRWTDFPDVHRQQFDQLATVFGDQRVFFSYYEVLGITKDLSPRNRRNEQDVRPFVREFLEAPAMLVVRRFLQQTDDPRYAQLNFVFSNTAYGACPRDLASGSTDIGTVSDVAGSAGSASGSHSVPLARKRKLDSHAALVPDRWGLRERLAEPNNADGTTDAILPAEYKAVHKLRGNVIRSVLGNDDIPPAESLVGNCAQRISSSNSDGSTDAQQPQQEGPPPADATPPQSDRVRRETAVAQTICQTYHYMIVYGTQYGFFTSGEATVFLKIVPGSYDTLLYHFVDHARPAVPITHPADDLVHVAAAQMATLVLQALVADLRDMATTMRLLSDLPRWPKPQPKLSGPSTSTSQGRGPSPGGDDDSNGGSANNKRRGQSRYRGPPASRSGTGSAPGGDGGTSGRAPPQPFNQVESPRTQYCTQACLLGLSRGGPLDPGCPNTPEHAQGERQATGDDGTPYHAISAKDVCSLVLEQLTRSLSAGVECLARYGYYGRIGSLFKVTLCAYGYTFVAKGVQDADAKRLRREAALYADPLMHPLQGVLIPVCLGVIELEEWPYFMPSGALVWHMMLMSWVGTSLAWHVPDEVADVDDAISDLEQELCNHGIYHQDMRSPNVAWNQERGRLMALDFDMAVLERDVGPSVPASPKPPAAADYSPAPAAAQAAIPPQTAATTPIKDAAAATAKALDGPMGVKRKYQVAN